MEIADEPVKFSVVFASEAASSYIRTVPVTTSDPAAASFALGFPPLTFAALTAGGVNPDGRDFNGMFNIITAWLQWYQAGGPIQYDGTFQTGTPGIDGYPLGALVASVTTLGLWWMSTVDGNATDPDTGGAGWMGVDIGFSNEQSLAAASTTDLGSLVSHLLVITGAATISSFGTSANIAAPIYLLRFSGASTLTYNATSMILPGAQSILTAAGDSALCEYMGSGNWRVLQYQRANGQSLVANVQFAVATGGPNAFAASFQYLGLPVAGTQIELKLPESNTASGPTLAVTIPSGAQPASTIYLPDGATPVPPYGLPIFPLLEWSTTNGGCWILLNAGATGWTLLETVSAGDVQTVTFSAIPQEFTTLRFIFRGVTPQAFESSATDILWGFVSIDGSSFPGTGAAIGAWGNCQTFAVDLDGYTSPGVAVLSASVQESTSNFDDAPWAEGTGSISGTVLTVTSAPGLTIEVGTEISFFANPGVLTVSSLGTGTGGTGTYNLSGSGTLSGGSAVFFNNPGVAYPGVGGTKIASRSDIGHTSPVLAVRWTLGTGGDYFLTGDIQMWGKV